MVIWLGKKEREKKKVADLPTLWQIGDEIGSRTFIFLGLKWEYLYDFSLYGKKKGKKMGE